MKELYIVYQHVTPDDMYYYGVTNNPKRRWGYNGIHYRDTSLYTYIEKFGWENIQHIVLYENLSYDDALKIEDSLIISGWEKGNCINKRRSGNVSKDDVYIHEYQREYQREYYEQNRDKLIQYQREYQQQNKEKIQELKKQYYEQNKEKIQERKKQYYEQNKEQIREQNKQYYEQNRDKFKEYYEDNKEQIREQRRQRYQRKKEEKQFRELGYVPLF